MDFRRGDANINAMLLARDCLLLGARTRVVTYITGLSPETIRQSFREVGPKGRIPTCSRWAHSHETVAEASVFAVIFNAISREQGYPNDVALITAYQVFQQQYIWSRSGRNGLDFDRAFSIVCELKGIWTHSEPILWLRQCPTCKARCLLGPDYDFIDGGDCAFCVLARRLVGRYPLEDCLHCQPVMPRVIEPRLLEAPSVLAHGNIAEVQPFDPIRRQQFS